MEFIKRILLASFIVAVSLFGRLAQAAPQSGDIQMGSVTEPTGESYRSRSGLSASLSRVTFYRIGQSYGVGASGLEVNGHYHTSLVSGSYSELCMVAPSTAVITARQVQVGDQVKNYRDATTQLTLRPGQETYRKQQYGRSHQ